MMRTQTRHNVVELGNEGKVEKGAEGAVNSCPNHSHLLALWLSIEGTNAILSLVLVESEKMTEEPSSDQLVEPGSFLHEPYPWPVSITDDAVDAAAIAEQAVAALSLEMDPSSRYYFSM